MGALRLLALMRDEARGMVISVTGGSPGLGRLIDGPPGLRLWHVMAGYGNGWAPLRERLNAIDAVSSNANRLLSPSVVEVLQTGCHHGPLTTNYINIHRLCDENILAVPTRECFKVVATC